MRLYKFISSMTTGLVLLALIGIASAVGSSLLPDTFFQTIPFRILLLSLFVNMALCTYNSLERFLKRRVQINKNWRLLLRSVSLIMLHAGVVFILIGASFYSFLGHSAQLSILEGDTVDISKVIHTNQPFSLQLNKFTIEFYEDGTPSQYFSDLKISEPEMEDKDYTISVNYPLTYNGIKFYQSSYGYLINVLIEDGDAEQKTALARDGDFIQFTSTKRAVKIFKYIPYFDASLGLQSKSMEPANPRVVYSVYDGKDLLGIGTASFGEKIQVDENVVIDFQEARPYSVLSLKSDPGLPLVALGGILLMLGVCLVLFGPRNGAGNIKKG